MNQQNTTETKNNERLSRPLNFLKKLGAGVLATLVIVGSGYAIENLSGGSNNPDKFSYVDKDINAITFGPGEYSIKHDPISDDVNDPTLIESLKIDTTTTIETKDGVRITGSNENPDYESITGVYYGLPSEYLPDFNDKGDNDNIVWVRFDKNITVERDNKK